MRFEDIFSTVYNNTKSQQEKDMSMIIVDNDGVVRKFGEYCLSEAIAPRKVDYGTNGERNNREYAYRNDMGAYTFMESGGTYFVVGVDDDDEVSFGSSEFPSFTIEGYSTKPRDTLNAMRAFGEIVYVALELARKRNNKKLVFSAANPALGKVYERAVRNKFVLGHMEREGFYYHGLVQGYFIFKRFPKVAGAIVA